MDILDVRFRAWEKLIRSQALRLEQRPDGLFEIKPLGSPAERLSADDIREHWAQRYVKEEFKRLGFSKVAGPFPRGPDYRVFQKGRWAFAEVETCWKNYCKHKHHVNAAFDKVAYLILLSAKTPTSVEAQKLPPKILHIDREHFLGWFEAASAPQAKRHRDIIRVSQVAGSMQEHWTTICSDANRDMAGCPNCDSCAYFGSGSFNEATPYYRMLANNFLGVTGLTSKVEADLTKIKSAQLREFVEMYPPE